MNNEHEHKKVGRPFVKGDKRINRTGRPKTFDELRRIADMIASELVPGPDGKMISRGSCFFEIGSKAKTRFCNALSSNTGSAKSRRKSIRSILEAKRR